MRMYKLIKVALFGATISMSTAVYAQNNKILLSTGVGLTKMSGDLNEVLKPLISFNSGLELELEKKWFIKGELTLSTLKYNQQIKDASSTYLFTNTNSSMFQLDLIAGKDFLLKPDKLLVGFYVGPGYLNIGEPRLTVDVINQRVNQQIKRTGELFGKVGTRLSFLTKSPFFKAFYVDGSYFFSSATIQQQKLNGFSFFIGSKFTFK